MYTSDYTKIPWYLSWFLCKWFKPALNAQSVSKVVTRSSFALPSRSETPAARPAVQRDVRLSSESRHWHSAFYLLTLSAHQHHNPLKCQVSTTQRNCFFLFFLPQKTFWDFLDVEYKLWFLLSGTGCLQLTSSDYLRRSYFSHLSNQKIKNRACFCATTINLAKAKIQKNV